MRRRFFGELDARPLHTTSWTLPLINDLPDAVCTAFPGQRASRSALVTEEQNNMKSRKLRFFGPIIPAILLSLPSCGSDDGTQPDFGA